MLLVCLLVIFLVLLLVFSMSRESGKNTKFARRSADNIAQNRETPQSIDTSKGIEIN